MLAAIRALVSPREKLRRALGDFELPVLPQVITNALEALREPEFELSAVGHELAADPGMSVELLRLVNSAAFGMRRPVESTDHAARLLGRARLESALVTVGIARALPSSPTAGFDPVGFWATARARATIASRVAERLHPATRAETITVALLQDMALPALAHAKPHHYDELLLAWRHGEGALSDLERSAFGFEHAEVGGWLCEAWGLPETLKSSIAEHHDIAPSASRLPAAALVATLKSPTDRSGLDELVALAREDLGLPENDAVALCTLQAEAA